MNVLFVCTGNICRSAMAEGFFKKLLADRNITDITCSSAGLTAMDGGMATENAVIAAEELGVDITEHRSRMLTRSIVRNADLIVCMTKYHFDVLTRMLPEEKIHILDGGVEDPYGHDLDFYRRCAKQIYDALPTLLDSLTA